MYENGKTEDVGVTSSFVKLLAVEDVGPVREKAPTQLWNEYCCKVDDELRETEERAAPELGPYAAISVIIAFVLAMILLLYSMVGD